ncbi:gag-pol polyprotein [Tanacetum coccineum]
MFEDLEYVQSLEKELDELQPEKNEFSNEYDLLLQEWLTNNIMCAALSSMADIDEYSEMACKYMEKIKECECLENELSKQKENVSKEVYIELLRSFAKLEKHSISLELTLQQCHEQLKNEKVWKQNESSSFRNEREQYFKIQDLKAQLQDKNIAISELKKLIEKLKGKYVDTKFDKPSVVRQPNALKIPKPSVLGKQTPFSDSLERKKISKTKSATKTNVSEGMYQIDTRTTQTRAPQLPQTSRNTNPCVSISTGVIHRTSVSRPQLKSTQMKDKGDLVQGNTTIKRVYYVEGLNHNLFLVGQFCDANLEVAFSKSTCFVRDLQGNDLLSGTRGFDLYIISSSKGRLNLLHMDLCGPMRIESINGKKCILVIVDDYSRYTWTYFLRSKDETDGEHLDKMKEKGDPCIMVGYSTQSKGYRVYNKRTKLIVESIHINFDEIKELSKASDYDNSGPAPQLQKTSDHNRSELGIQDHNNEQSSSKLVPNVSPPADTTTPSLQELDFLFSPLFEEYFTAGNQSVSKSSALFDNSKQQDTQPTLNVQPTTEPITPTINVNAEENNNDQAVDA